MIYVIPLYVYVDTDAGGAKRVQESLQRLLADPMYKSLLDAQLTQPIQHTIVAPPTVCTAPIPGFRGG